MQVKRQRLSRRLGRRLPLITAGTTALVVVAGTGIAYGSTHQFGFQHVTQVTNKGLDHLKGLDQLEDLNLGGTLAKLDRRDEAFKAYQEYFGVPEEIR